LIVRIDELPESGRVFHLHRNASWLPQMVGQPDDLGQLSLTRPLNADLDLTPEKDTVKVKGWLQAWVKLPCSRCLCEFSMEIAETFEFQFIQARPDEMEEDIDLKTEEMNTEFFDGMKIDLDRIIAEQIFLAIPQKPLCHEGCRGLCPGCGNDLNREPCNCRTPLTESPFAALRSLKLD